LYFFLPATLIIYFITPMPNGSARLRNIVLLVASIIFYAWGEPIFSVVKIAQCIIAWALALLIDKYRGYIISKIIMIVSVAITLSALLIFKYADFFIWNINNLFNSNLGLLRLILPIGISFYTFQILNYTIDLYFGKIKVNRNIIDFSTYVLKFPQLIAGPIVRYADVEATLSKRVHSIEDVALGVRRFVIGLGKKVIFANMMGELVEIYKNSGESSVLFAWMYVIAFALQIYFDFSGYSDMALGLGRIFGFRFLENFNYPYIAKSITDFWRRWHISLSTWFRDYVYIPLGGNRVPGAKHVFNILIVWLLTGFWHGAAWNFVLWGLYFGLILLAEKFILSKVLDKMPNFLRHSYVLIVVLISWVFFNAYNFAEINETLSQMFGFGADSFAGIESLYYLRSYFIPLLIASIGCTPIIKRLADKLSTKKSFLIIEPISIGVLLVFVTAFLVDGSFNPFIYFRF